MATGRAKEAGGSCSVLIRGFDFRTSEEQIATHMSNAGAIESVEKVDDGSACVTYSLAEEANAAVQQFQQTVIAGNSRYIDVISLDPEEFLVGHNVDSDKAKQFFQMNQEQHLAIMGRGPLSTARDPTAVLCQRMKQVKGVGKGRGCGGKHSVLVRGFDFGTSEEEIGGHMATVGTVQSIQWADEGSACITYSCAEEATAAVQQLQETRIPGNSRYIDVLVMDPEEFLAEHNIESDKARQFLNMTPEQQQLVMTRGGMSSARDPTAVLIMRMKEAKGKSKGDASAKGLGGKGGDPGGTRSVLVRGFDFRTEEEQIADHMSSAGTIQGVRWIDDGSVYVTYRSAQEASAAVQNLQQTCIAGNSRYIDVHCMDPAQFLGGYDIEQEKAWQFSALTPDQQQTVMGKGSLSSARDPNAVLFQRMKQVAGVEKGSFGPSKGLGGMTSGKGSGPYGGMGKGGCKGGKSKDAEEAFELGRQTAMREIKRQQAEEAFELGMQTAMREMMGKAKGGKKGGFKGGGKW